MGNPIDVAIGRQLKKIRESLDISIDALANHLKTSVEEANQLEHGEKRISASQLFEISRYLNTPISEFFDGLNGGS